MSGITPDVIAEHGLNSEEYDRIETALGREPVDYQAKVMESVVDNRFTAWRGCHSCGKEHALGSLAVWGAGARGMLVLVLSATETQVVGQTMREVGDAFAAAADEFGLGFKRYRRSIRIGGEDRVVALTGSADVDALIGGIVGSVVGGGLGVTIYRAKLP